MKLLYFVIFLCIPMIPLMAEDSDSSISPSQVNQARSVELPFFYTLRADLVVIGGAQFHRLDFKGIEFEDQVMYLAGIFPRYGLQMNVYSDKYDEKLSGSIDLSYGPIQGAYEYFNHNETYLRYHHFEYGGGKLTTRFGVRYQFTTSKFNPFLRAGIQFDNLVSLVSFDDYHLMNKTTGTTTLLRNEWFLLPKKFWYGVFAGVGFDWQVFPKNSIQLEALINLSGIVLQSGNNMQTAQITLGYLL